MRQLYVYYNEIKAGTLTERVPGEEYSFLYDVNYLASDLPPVSLTLPKQNEDFLSKSLFPFFVNMLPEGANRRMICNKYKIDETDFFGLLSVMANKDVIGAINIRK